MAKRSLPERPDIEEKVVGALYSKTDIVKTLAEYYNDALPRCGYVEDHFWTNIRIILCMICCGFGLYAQFGTKFPQDRSVLMMCVLAYFAVSSVLAALDFWIMSISVMCIKLGEESVFLDVNLPAFESKLTTSLRSSKRTVSVENSVGLYFDSDGLLCQENVFNDFASLVAKWEQAGKDGSSKKDK
mmetsp:Transcript_60054/g.152391  ORF Transcript_60054/g.152391 Transcript_60054/m.152391 type:complete len:186 (-) Transcript_60054:47-604(-)